MTILKRLAVLQLLVAAAWLAHARDGWWTLSAEAILVAVECALVFAAGYRAIRQGQRELAASRQRRT